MIGKNYWSTGITIVYHEGVGWGAEAKFYDDGFCDEQSSEGTLKSRYLLKDCAAVVDIVKADIEKLGIEWKNQHVYFMDEETPGLIAGWREIANEQAVRLGWEPVYRSTAPTTP